VLAIAAVKLGFGPLVCFDRDPLAVGATAENAGRNGVALEVAQADVLVDPLPPAPLWIANLELGLLRSLLARPDLPPRILVSGLLDPETVGGGERVVAGGWAAELVEP
jgi:ribosomal protein L11 methyltransferase